MFILKVRDNGEKFYTLSDDSPDWIKEAVRDAHCGMLPCDWVWSECHDVYSAIEDGSVTDEDSLHEYADNSVDVYTKALYQWAADMCLSSLFSDASEVAKDVLDANSDIETQLKCIQYNVILYIAQVIINAHEENSK